MELPYQQDLPVHLLAWCFNNTSATYKFFSFLAVLGRVELGETKDFEARPVRGDGCVCAVYDELFGFLFGKQDKLQEATESIKSLEN